MNAAVFQTKPKPNNFYAITFELASDVISDVDVEQVGINVPAKFDVKPVSRYTTAYLFTSDNDDDDDNDAADGPYANA